MQSAPLYAADAGDLDLGVVGDCLPTRRLSVFSEERFLAVRELLRGCDSVFGNLESTVHRPYSTAHLQHEGGGTYMSTEPEVIADLRWLGVDLLAAGSSHADDHGQDGIVETMGHLDAAGFTHAGSGRNLAEARMPNFRDTARGRIAVVAATMKYNSGSRAGEQRHDATGHPGVNAIRSHVEYTVTGDIFDDVRRIGARIGNDAHLARRATQGDAQSGVSAEVEYRLLGHVFRRGNDVQIRHVADERDVTANLRSVALARELSDFVVCSLHNHEQGGPGLLTENRRSAIDQPSDAGRDFARRAIEAGADVFVGHGPQVPLGIEIFRGRPIFHGLGCFVFQPETVRQLPAEAYDRYRLDASADPADFLRARYRGDTVGHPADPAQWQQFAAVCAFRAGRLSEVRIHPLDLGFGRSRAQRGRPMLARREVADAVIARVSDASRRYGTTVENRDGVGVLTLS